MMATTPKSKTLNLSKLFGVRGHQAAVERASKAERADRYTAGTKSKILANTDVGGEYDAERFLLTTLGGKSRPITHDDIRTFREFSRKLGARLKGGITAQQAINLSRPEDRERANEEIRIATVVQAWPAGPKAGTLQFVTNSGPDSDVARHYVHVRFHERDWAAYVAAPGKRGADTKTLATDLLKRQIRFECDCGRFRYWFRYIATIGGFVHGRPEEGYPDQRNPQLQGVCCKHLLRVMRAMTHDPAVRGRVSEMLERARTQVEVEAPIRVTAKEAKEAARRQEAEAKRGLVKSRVESTQEAADRKAAAARTPAGQKRALDRAAKLAQKRAEMQARDAQLSSAAEKLKSLLGTVSKQDAKRLLDLLSAQKA
ncbi:hypothetical protein [Ideonella livida]|uniref:SWIM-type domain-containing protein n=1 Tax=Ideonella livida TaxID=2707176 RepID=A0A7C9TID3_9BURK|nr:hypothetical protein [Ideonella livida]NDY89725.1 hypothetical protein [Ideonella livida]